jgi:hypothetical protein
MSSQPTVILVVTISFKIISAILGSILAMRSSSKIGLRSSSVLTSSLSVGRLRFADWFDDDDDDDESS